MTDFWILFLIFSTMYSVHPGRRCVTAQTFTEPPVYQPDKELSVCIGDSATLRCCISAEDFGMTACFKQTDRKPPQLVIRFFKSSDQIFYSGDQKNRLQIERSLNCFNMTILNITRSDEAVYFCALLETHNPVFGDGTYFRIKETSKAARCDDTEVCEPTLHGNNTNIMAQDKTVLGLGAALGLCVFLIVGLSSFILTRRKHDRLKANVEDSAGMMQEAETLNYAALQFSKRNLQSSKQTKTGSWEVCVYSDIKKSVKSN